MPQEFIHFHGRSALVGLILLGGLTPVTAAQNGQPAPGSREAMWPAPTEADWAMPCLVKWQRSFEDAVLVARESGKPILICVNMDGEIASEHYAGVRYRRADTAELYAPYVTVIASVYRHTPRDFDNRGQRVLCPRFGGVTCGEHIAIEPGLYDGFFEGQRVAPRHVMVEIEESGGYAESYDIFYAFDTDSVFEAIRMGIVNRPAVPELPDLERTTVQLVASANNEDRTAVEMAYRDGDRESRRVLLRAAKAQSIPFQPGLLRLALFDLDLDLNRIARSALADARDAQAIDLILEALQVPMAGSEREGLIAALELIGESSARAQTLAVVQRGLVGESATVDLDSWRRAMAEVGDRELRVGLSLNELQLDYKSRAVNLSPENPGAELDLAEAYLAYAIHPDDGRLLAPDVAGSRKYVNLLLEDALRAARKAEELGSKDWRVHAVVALAAKSLGKRRAAHERAQAAMQVMPAGAEGWMAMATLALFAESRQRAIHAAMRDQTPWPSDWLTDVNAAYSVLGASSFGTAEHVVAHVDFLRRLGATAQAAAVLGDGLERFPASWELHARLRGQVLDRDGLEMLETVYEQKLAQLDASSDLEWYAGYASLVVAEFRRRAGEGTEALAAYGRGIEHFERAAQTGAPGTATSADHYIALALAGRARLALERGDHAAALREITASFDRRSAAAATQDGLGLTPVATAQMLLSSAREAGQADIVITLEAALGNLDPLLLHLPSFEKLGSQ